MNEMQDSRLQEMVDKAVAKAVADLVPKETKVKQAQEVVYKIDPNKDYGDNVIIKLSYPFKAKQIAAFDLKWKREGLSGRAEALRRAVESCIGGDEAVS